MAKGQTPAVMIERNADCPDCGQVHDIEACPDCGADIIEGFGVGFGPYGFFKVCEAFCGWVWNDPEDVGPNSTVSVYDPPTEEETTC